MLREEPDMDGGQGPTREAVEEFYPGLYGALDGPPPARVVYELLVHYGLPGLSWEHPGFVVVYSEPGGLISRGSGCPWDIVYGEYIGIYAGPEGWGGDAIDIYDVPEGEGPDWVARRIIALVEDNGA